MFFEYNFLKEHCSRAMNTDILLFFLIRAGIANINIACLWVLCSKCNFSTYLSKAKMLFCVLYDIDVDKCNSEVAVSCRVNCRHFKSQI